MASVWRMVVFGALLAGCLCDDRPGDLRLDSVQVPTDPSCQKCNWWPFKTKTTTKRTTTTQSTTLQTNHSTVPSTTAETNHTTTPATTAQTNHTTTPVTTEQTNHTTTPVTTEQTNHTTTPATTAQTNHTTTPATTAQTNHTTTPVTTAHTNHTTTPITTAQTNHTTAPTNHTTMVSTTAHANHTTAPQPTSPPPPSEYFVNGTTGVCLRIKANFVITLNFTKIINVTVPNGPETKASGNCSKDAAELTLSFPNGNLTLTFRQNKKEKKFSLAAVNITVQEKATVEFSNSSLEVMSTPLGRSFSCKEVLVKLSPAVTFVLSDVQVQAFDLPPGGNFGKEYNCSKGPTDNTVPIVVGIVLLVLIVIVVLVYIIARQRKHREGYQTL